MAKQQYGLVSYKGKRWYQGDGSPAPWLDVATGEKAPEEYWPELDRLLMLKKAAKIGAAWPALRARLAHIASMLAGLGRLGRRPVDHDHIRNVAEQCRRDGTFSINRVATLTKHARGTVRKALGLDK